MDTPESIADVLRDIAAAVRELADRSEPDPLLHADDVAALLGLPVRAGRGGGDPASAVR